MAFNRRETITLIVGDFLILVLSLASALTLRNLEIPSFSYFQVNFGPFLPMFGLSLVIFYIAGLYEKQTRPILRVMGVRILGAQATNVAIAAILFFVLPLDIAPKTILVLYLIVSVVAEGLWRFYRMNRELKTEKRVRAILVGSGEAVTELYEEVRENPRYLMHFVALVEPDGQGTKEFARSIRTQVEESSAQALVLDVSDRRVAEALPMLYDLLSRGTIFIEFAALYEEIFDRVPLEHLNATHLVDAFPEQRAIYDTTKRLFDIVLAVVGSVIALPFVAVAAAILTLSGGTPFITQERVGKNGNIIHLRKLRTRLFDDRGNPELHAKNRPTAFGTFLRKTRIDELPQLWSILKGELSFIGPRPEIEEIVAVYEREIPHYHLRHLIVPGLSGWAQIHDYDAPRGPADVERTRRKVSFDLYYLKHRSVGLDLAIAVKSIRALLAFSGK